MEIDCTALKKFLKLPIRAIPSGPTKMAINLEMRIPATILIVMLAVIRLAALINTTLLI